MNKYDFLTNLVSHTDYVRKMANSFGGSLGLSEKDANFLDITALFHDYGKKHVDISILSKPAKLNKRERKKMMLHIAHGAYEAIDSHNQVLRKCALFILCHHENYDGSGYLGICGKHIPYISRIIRIIDVYCALTEERPYRKALRKSEAIKVMLEEKHHFDPVLFKCFLSSMESGKNFCLLEEIKYEK